MNHAFVPAALAFVSTLLAPTLALACPAARAASSCGPCGSSISGYLVAIGAGLLAGAGSVAFEIALKKRG